MTARIKTRLMQADDFDAIVGIDEKVVKASRREYYELKFEKLFKSSDYLPTSLVAENEDGTVVGFVMGELFMGEFGIVPGSSDPGHRRRRSRISAAGNR